MNTLYEIADAYRRFAEAVEAGEIPEEAIADTLEGLDGALEDKADNIACLIKELLAQAESIKAEETALAERRKAKENHAARLKSYLAEQLTAAGKTRVETARNAISFRRSSALEIYDEDAFMAWDNAENYLTYQQPKINRKDIGDAIRHGMEVPGCKVVDRQNIQIR